MKSLLEFLVSNHTIGSKQSGVYDPEVRGKVNLRSISDLEIGDILVAAYQYSARFVDFYEVVGFKGKATVLVKHLKDKKTGNQNGTSVPLPGEYEEENPITVRFGKRFRIDDRYTYLWDGQPEDYYTD